jgi:heat-inducible transcriptional repressor
MTQSRRLLVLRAVVEDYIRSQEPVGSTSLTRQHDLGVSSATIRNDMAALEDEGYLIQPHTSAGRVPTEKGYRYFVDRLATVVPLNEAQRRGINSFLSGSVSLKDALQRSARLLSEITGQVAVVASPSLAKATLRHVEMVPVAMTTLLAVVITDTGRVAQHGLNVTAMPTVESVNRLSAAVNGQCSGLSLAQSAETVRSIAGDAGYDDVREVADALADAFDSMASAGRASELYMSGTSHLAHSQSLADLAPLFDALEEQVVLMKLMSNLSEETNAAGVGVAIGSEMHTPGLLHASVVSSGYGRSAATGESTPGESSPDHGADGEPIAFVGSIGPTHMNYAVTMAAVKAVSKYLTAFIGEASPGD